jgi:hypothetical protein
LKGKGDLLFLLADLIGRDLSLHAAPASSDILQRKLHEWDIS